MITEFADFCLGIYFWSGLMQSPTSAHRLLGWKS